MLRCWTKIQRSGFRFVPELLKLNRIILVQSFLHLSPKFPNLSSFADRRGERRDGSTWAVGICNWATPFAQTLLLAQVGMPTCLPATSEAQFRTSQGLVVGRGPGLGTLALVYLTRCILQRDPYSDALSSYRKRWILN